MPHGKTRPHETEEPMFRKNIGYLIEAAGSALLRRITKKPLPRTVIEWRYVDCSFSQFAEDLLVLRALESLGKTEIGYYVDVGAFDPMQYSNTLRLHWRGWRGINIDAQEKHVARFNIERPDDTNIHLAVARKTGIAEFLCYESGTTGRLLGTGSATSRSALGEEVRETTRVPTAPLACVLRTHAPTDRPFGFLSVDVEGADLEVLQSNDWSTYRPWIIAVEDHTKDSESDIDKYCQRQGYQLFAMANVTKIFLSTKLHNIQSKKPE